MENLIKINQQILREQWITELDETLANIKIQTNSFYRGIAGFLFNGIVSWVYSFFLSPDIREKTLKQIEVLLRAAEKFNGDENALINEFFNDFKVNDVGYIRCKKTHKKFPEFIERMKIIFLHRVKSTVELINCNGGCKNHGDLIVKTYKTLENAKADLKLQLDEAEDQLDFAIKYNLLAVNGLILPQTIKILKGEIEFRRNLFESSLIKYFNNSN
ncbi:MAG: hypothetical protein EAX96_05950 [Candidatus Lokiarchaeota archaeon]|nr:hypothetical protein [Candidatus Lokiarchaeota archaeon]